MLRTAIVAIILSQAPASVDGIAHFFAAQPFLEQRDYQAAANELGQALQDKSLTPGLGVWAHTELGAIFDLTGQSDRALGEYDLVLRSTSGERDPARAFVMQRVKDGRLVSELRVLPNFLSLSSVPSLASAVVVHPASKAVAEYSAEARVAELEGNIGFLASVAADGSVRDLKMIEPLGLGLDEAARTAGEQWRFEPSGGLVANVLIDFDFVVPGKVSRWHLIGVTFKPLEGASRPHFLTTSYPPGAGVSNAGLDEAGFVEYTKRQAVAKVAFEVDALGHPVNFQRPTATYSSWGPEAVSVVRRWRFSPGMKDGVAVTTPCEVTLVWGNKQFTHESIVGAKKTAAMLVEVEALRAK
jgi:hypothetical protein